MGSRPVGTAWSGAMATDISGYEYTAPARCCAHAYLLPAIDRVLRDFGIAPSPVFDLGCGNGSFAQWLTAKGFEVHGVDPSTQGIAIAHKAHPTIDLRVGSCYDPLHESFGTFPLVTSLEVVEHVYAPRDYARCVHTLLQPGGRAPISTPYHGYLKNLAMALCDKMDDHFSPLWDHGHIKFWSPRTLTRLLDEAGLKVLRVDRVGRIPPLAKSMLVVAERPR